jgi:hypothetical protein
MCISSVVEPAVAYNRILVYIYIYSVVLTECGGDDGLLDTAIHHQPHAQAQQQRGNIITITNVFGLHMLQFQP